MWRIAQRNDWSCYLKDEDLAYTVAGVWGRGHWHHERWDADGAGSPLMIFEVTPSLSMNCPQSPLNMLVLFPAGPSLICVLRSDPASWTRVHPSAANPVHWPWCHAAHCKPQWACAWLSRPSTPAVALPWSLQEGWQEAQGHTPGESQGAWHVIWVSWDDWQLSLRHQVPRDESPPAAMLPGGTAGEKGLLSWKFKMLLDFTLPPMARECIQQWHF